MDGINEVEIPVAGGRTIAGSLALPPVSGHPVPGVIVIHEVVGLNDDMRRKAKRLNEMGYAAIAPDLFSHRGPNRRLCLVGVMRDLRHGSGEAFDDIQATQDFLGRQPGVDPTRMGVIGFCLGGGFALLHAAKGGVRVASPFYGSVPQDAERLRGICPVVGGYGAKDRAYGWQGERLRRALTKLGVVHDVVTYPRAGHAYMSPGAGRGMKAKFNPAGRWMHVRYNRASAEDSWARIDRFFSEHLCG